jgi:chromosome partitioning protein
MTSHTAPTIIAFASGKGGVGKSTSCLGLAGALVASGHKVHVVDFDQTQTLWGWFSTNDAARAIPGLTVEQAPKANLDQYVEDLYNKRHGFVLIDLAGSLTDLMMLIAAFATVVIIPTKLGWADVLEANKLAEKLHEVGKRLNKPIAHRILLNEIPFIFASSQLHMLRQIEELGIQRFQTLVHTRPAYAEPHITGIPLHFDDLGRAPTRKAVEELNCLLAELMDAIAQEQLKAAA